MRSTGYLLALLLSACLCAVAPTAATATSPVETTEVTQAVLAAPPGPDLPDQKPPPQGPDRRRIAIGTAGAALIVLVLLTRKARKKPVLGFRWKKKE